MSPSSASPLLSPGGAAAAAAATISSSAAVGACAAMAVFYVAILYLPALVLPPPTSFRSFMLRRFACAFVASLVSVLACILLLGSGELDSLPSVLDVLGIRSDRLWQAVTFPLMLTSLIYSGSFVKKLWSMVNVEDRGSSSIESSLHERVKNWVHSFCMQARNVMVWRNYVVAPITEELVFRACMIPLLLCGGFRIYNIIFFSPVFFSLAHLNHFLELYYQQRCSLVKALMILGLQLGYTVIFGWYASFLFIRTGNVISATVAHIFCNIMGLPVMVFSRSKGAATAAFALGSISFIWLLFPSTSPYLYNDRNNGCSCWHGYCRWS